MALPQLQRPTAAFVGASWIALLVGGTVYLFGLWNASMLLNEKGYYLTILLYGLFASVSLQKSVRDRLEGIRVTGIYFGLCWLSLGIAITLLTVGLWNATLSSSEISAFLSGPWTARLACIRPDGRPSGKDGMNFRLCSVAQTPLNL